jgi:membrane-associated protease RseP (regulator of RpoE activity)
MVSVFSIMLSHEMGHKLTADKHGVEASYPYFIPGPPPFGTFGAVIKQKTLAPNKDALFDLGASGPVSGFVITFVLAVIGIQMSQIHIVTELPPATLQTPLLLDFLVAVLLNPPAVPPGTNLLIQPSPVGYAAWIGALITMLQLFPTGTLDGGHAVRSLLGERGRGILSFISIIAMAVLGYYIMAIIVLLLSMGRHPGPLDDVSELSKGRRFASIGLALIFIVVLTPISF